MNTVLPASHHVDFEDGIFSAVSGNEGDIGLPDLGCPQGRTPTTFLSDPIGRPICSMAWVIDEKQGDR
jgi:hypothetical protein